MAYRPGHSVMGRSGDNKGHLKEMHSVAPRVDKIGSREEGLIEKKLLRKSRREKEAIDDKTTESLTKPSNPDARKSKPAAFKLPDAAGSPSPHTSNRN